MSVTVDVFLIKDHCVVPMVLYSPGLAHNGYHRHNYMLRHCMNYTQYMTRI